MIPALFAFGFLTVFIGGQLAAILIAVKRRDGHIDWR